MFEKLCDNCSHKNCCTDSAVPLVFAKDLEKILSKDPNHINNIKTININGKNVKAIKKKKDSTKCVYWDEDIKGCKIYDSRPIDCRLYPFDIISINNSFHWIVYSCNKNSDWSWSDEYLDTLEKDEGFKDLIENFDIFSDHTEMILPKESKKTPYTIIRKVKT